MRSRYGDMGEEEFWTRPKENRSRISLLRAFPFSLSLPFSLPFFFFFARDLSVDDVPFSSFDLSEPVLFYFILLLSRNFFSRRSVTFSFSFPLSFVLLVPLTLLFYSLSL